MAVPAPGNSSSHRPRVVLLMICQFTASFTFAALVTVLVMGILPLKCPRLQVYVVPGAGLYAPKCGWIVGIGS